MRDLAMKFMLVVAVTMPINAFNHGCYFTLRSGGKTLITFFFDSVYTLIVNIPLAFVLARYTTLDVVLPQIFTGVKFTKEDFVRLGDGGFCQSCDGCHWPNCTFGRY